MLGFRRSRVIEIDCCSIIDYFWGNIYSLLNKLFTQLNVFCVSKGISDALWLTCFNFIDSAIVKGESDPIAANLMLLKLINVKLFIVGRLS